MTRCADTTPYAVKLLFLFFSSINQLFVLIFIESAPIQSFQRSRSPCCSKPIICAVACCLQLSRADSGASLASSALTSTTPGAKRMLELIRTGTGEMRSVGIVICIMAGNQNPKIVFVFSYSDMQQQCSGLSAHDLTAVAHPYLLHRDRPVVLDGVFLNIPTGKIPTPTSLGSR